MAFVMFWHNSHLAQCRHFPYVLWYPWATSPSQSVRVATGWHQDPALVLCIKYEVLSTAQGAQNVIFDSSNANASCPPRKTHCTKVFNSYSSWHSSVQFLQSMVLKCPVLYSLWVLKCSVLITHGTQVSSSYSSLHSRIQFLAHGTQVSSSYST